MNLAQINKAYHEALSGVEEPFMMHIVCPTCRVGFTLIKGRKNEICEHLTLLLKEYE